MNAAANRDGRIARFATDPRPGRVNSEACPRCGCYIVHHFDCGCGACCDDSCGNCGRWTWPTLERTEHVELTVEAPARCEAGAVEHCHIPFYLGLTDDLWRRL